MFHRIQQYGLLDVQGRWYRPRAYAEPQADGTWDGWLVFFPLAGGTAIAPPGPETTQGSVAALATWAAALTPLYLESALARALGLAQQPPVITRLTHAEYEALDDAERLETASQIERTSANLDEAAARAARADAERIRRQRFATEAALAGTEEAAATIEANTHEQAAREARATAAAADRRRRSAVAKATPRRQKTRTGTKKK